LETPPGEQKVSH